MRIVKLFPFLDHRWWGEYGPEEARLRKSHAVCVTATFPVLGTHTYGN